MSNRRPESHVAQQIRRDRLRIHKLEDFQSNLEHLSSRPGISSDLVQVRSVRNANMLYEPGFYSPEAANFSTVPNPLVESTRLMSTMPQYSSLEEQCQVRNIGYWRNSSVSHHVCDLLPNEGNPYNPNSMFGVGITNELAGETASTREGHGMMQEGSEMASLTQQTDHGVWVGNGNQFFFLPNCGIQSNQLRLGSPNQTVENESKNQGLSLSLSSNSQPLPLRCVSNPSSNGGDRVKPIQNIDYRNVGPLGPFTGYATILKSSSYLKPAQELLEAICGGGQSQSNGKIRKGAEVVNYARNESNDGDGGNRRGAHPSSRLDYQQRMAKFLYMQEEVIRRYKQHQQQMQMIIPSFESVAGLGSATPYISKALKSVSRQFRSLENAISDQVKHIREILGEELSGTTSGGATSSTSGKHDSSNIARLKFLDQSFQKNKFIAASSTGCYVEHQQNSWRPQQKGLPERAVSVLRAWLFDHFLHPYPTDADKHMLAARTGLSRNQVSNWFINARVRVWKPMVEEIHMLETKGGLTSEINVQNAGKNEGTCALEGGHGESRGDQLQCVESHMDEEPVAEEELNAQQQWDQEKRSKLECHMEGTLMGFVPYRRAEVEAGAVGPVSLTLGLKHGDVEAIQQHHHHLSRHFGGHVINDFVG